MVSVHTDTDHLRTWCTCRVFLKYKVPL